MTYQDIPGWFTWEPLYKRMVDNARDGDVFVEVGVFLGKSAIYMAQQIKESGKKINFYCVDLWNRDVSGISVKEAGGSFFSRFIKNSSDCGVCEYIMPTVASSALAARCIREQVDFVFIDAEHDYNSVRWDISDWLPKLNDGGVMAGHDYTLNADTKRAVDDTFGPAVRVEGECWFVHL